MPVQNPDRVVTKQDLADFYQAIRPYLIRKPTATVYGFKVDSTKSTGNVSYNVQYDGRSVANYDFNSAYTDFSNNNAWVWGNWSQDDFFMPRPVLINQAYNDKIYLNVNDYTKDVDGNDVTAKLTGAEGNYNAMMEWGRDGTQIWYKLVPDTNDVSSYTCYIANQQMDEDFHAWSFYDANDNLNDHFYTAIYLATHYNNCARSISGKQVAQNVTVGDMLSKAKANNKNNETYAWYGDVLADRILINLLLILVTKSTNSDTVGYGMYSSINLTTIYSGSGNNKGLFYGTHGTADVSKVFGMENWWGGKIRVMYGLTVSSTYYKYKFTYGTADGSVASGYNEHWSNPSNYLTSTLRCDTTHWSYITKYSVTSDGLFVPTASGGADGTYYSDFSDFKSNDNGVFVAAGMTSQQYHGVGAFALAGMSDNNFLSYESQPTNVICQGLTLKPQQQQSA